MLWPHRALPRLIDLFQYLLRLGELPYLQEGVGKAAFCCQRLQVILPEHLLPHLEHIRL